MAFRPGHGDARFGHRFIKHVEAPDSFTLGTSVTTATQYRAPSDWLIMGRPRWAGTLNCGAERKLKVNGRPTGGRLEAGVARAARPTYNQPILAEIIDIRKVEQ